MEKSEVKLTVIERTYIENIKKRMHTLGVNTTEISRQTGLPMPMVSRILNGKQRASFDIWQKLFDVVKDS